MEELNILVTGNGFDLHHHMKTKYTDFLEFIKMYYNSTEEAKEYQLNIIQNVKNKETIEKLNKYGDSDFLLYFSAYLEQVNTWVDFEQLIKGVIDFFKWYINIEKSGGDSLNFNSVNMNATHKLIAKNFYKSISFEKGYYFLKKEYLSTILGINYKKILAYLITEFDNLCIIFETYLKDIEPVVREKKNNYVYEQIKNINADHVITFNYTNIYDKYGIPKEKITYLHGSLENENIVLGYNDDNEKDLQFVYFKKYFQCIINGTDILENTIDRLNIQLRNSIKEHVHIHFFGHSLDKTDEEELVQLLEWGQYVTVYYMDLDDKCEKIMKIIDLLEKKKAVKRIKEKTIVFEQITGKTC